MFKKIKLFLISCLIMFWLMWSTFWYKINDYFILDKGHDLFKIQPQNW